MAMSKGLSQSEFDNMTDLELALFNVSFTIKYKREFTLNNTAIIQLCNIMLSANGSKATITEKNFFGQPIFTNMKDYKGDYKKYLEEEVYPVQRKNKEFRKIQEKLIREEVE